MANITLGSAMNTIEERMNKTRSNKLEISALNGSGLISMDRPLTMAHDAFVESFKKAMQEYHNREIASMSAIRVAKRGLDLDASPCTFKVTVH